MATESAADCERKRRDFKRHAQLKSQRSTWDLHWLDLISYILPRRGRIAMDAASQANFGDKRTGKIVESTPTRSVRTLSSGFMSGVTSPARLWFKLGSPDPMLAAVDAVKQWFDESTRRMSDLFTGSNLYETLPESYLDLGMVGTFATLFEEDDEDVFRFYAFEPGEFYLATNRRGDVDTFHCEIAYTVGQLVDEFAEKDKNGAIVDWSNISEQVRAAYETGATESWINVLWVVCPNEGADADRIGAEFKRYRSTWYEQGSVNSDRTLRAKGFDEFPILTGRWSTNGKNVYGEAPAMDVLPDIKALQILEKRKAQAIEKQVSPPLLADASLGNGQIDVRPGGITYFNRRANDGTNPAVIPTYQVALDLSALREDIQLKKKAIQSALYTDLFLMLANDARTQPPTAEEIKARQEEKLLALGPVLERLDHEVFDRLIKRAFAIMARRGLLPPTPQELVGKPIQIEYVSVMAQAQKLVGLGSQERLLGYVGQLSQFYPEVVDKIDADRSVERYNDVLGAPPDLIRSSDDVAAIRAKRAQQMQAQQNAQAALAAAKTARDLSGATLDGNTVLGQMMNGGGNTGAALPA